MNMSNITTTSTTFMSSRLTTPTPLVMLLRRSSADILMPTTTATTTRPLVTDNLTFSCPPDRWGRTCEHICKPCGLGTCHPTTGQCICPKNIYGEFCDLWQSKKRIISMLKFQFYIYVLFHFS